MILQNPLYPEMFCIPPIGLADTEKVEDSLKNWASSNSNSSEFIEYSKYFKFKQSLQFKNTNYDLKMLRAATRLPHLTTPSLALRSL